MHDFHDARIYQRACVGLVRLGHEVHFVVSRHNEAIQNEGVEFHWIKNRQGWRRRWFSSIDAVNIAIGLNADIYHFHDPDLLPHILKIKRKLPKAKIVYDIHENYQVRFQQWGFPIILGRFFQKYQIRKINQLDGFVTTTETMKKLFSEVYKPGVVIRNSVDTHRLNHLNIAEVLPFETPTIYTSGTHSHSRLVLQTVQSMKYLPKDLNFRMLFAGRYSPGIEEKLIAQAKKDGTSKLLFLEKMLPWAENFRRTAKAMCGCVFYEDNLNNQVTLPNRVYEYMFCGIPIVVSDYPELRNIINMAKCGVIIKSEEPNDIAEAFEFLLRNPEKAIEMGNNGRKAIFGEFGYHLDLDNLDTFYTKILNS